MIVTILKKVRQLLCTHSDTVFFVTSVTDLMHGNVEAVETCNVCNKVVSKRNFSGVELIGMGGIASGTELSKKEFSHLVTFQYNLQGRK